MIAFIREPEPPPKLPAVRRLRRLLASTLLVANRENTRDALPPAAWKAWLFTAWVVGCAVWCIVGLVRDLW